MFPQRLHSPLAPRVARAMCDGRGRRSQPYRSACSKRALAIAAAAMLACPFAQAQQVVDLPSRPGVTERMLVLAPAQPKATLLLLTGGAGHVNIRDDGKLPRPDNFLVRSRERFEAQGFAVIVLDAPSDHGRPNFMSVAFRESPEHAADLAAVVQWARQKFARPVWIVGTSRGTQSAAFAAITLTGTAAPDGVVLTSSILAHTQRGDNSGLTVPEMDLSRVAMPVLVVHHEQDPCPACKPSLLPELMKKFPAGRAELKTVSGGESQGPDCEPFSHHGYNGIEEPVVAAISAWIREHP